ncbi:non-ribosomal peptide synthetase, partial [Chengkuizengella sediminis]|uniref:non-ribosomal peptide synthetase n=1 Tax=Chengkuizengella sediminis TaxID=1885917 RepID=UPI001F0FED44
MLLYDKKRIKEREYWMSKLSDWNTETYIPFYSSNVMKQSDVENESTIQTKVNDMTYHKLLKICNHSDQLLFIFILSAVKICIYKYTGINHITIGTTLDKTFEDQEKDHLFLAICDSVDSEKSFRDLVLEVQSSIVGAYKHANYPLNRILEDLKLKIPMNENKTFEVAVLYENIHDLQSAEMIDSHVKIIINNDNHLYLTVNYNENEYSMIDMERFSKHVEHILSQVVENPTITLREVELVTSEEKEQILHQFNNEKLDFSKEITIHELFEAQVEKTPDEVAVVFEEQKLTYKQLNEKANQLAQSLNNKGVQANELVAIMADRSLEMIIGILSILKAGAAYVPIDPSHPEQRIQYMLKDSRSKWVLTQTRYFNQIKIEDGEVIDLENKELYQGDSNNRLSMTKSHDLAYVIYTSGSTGEPKGVMVEHLALHNFIEAIYDQFNRQIDVKDRCLSLTNISFDVSVGEIFLPLMLGARLVLFDFHKTLDIHLLQQTIINEDITFAYIPPTILPELAQLLETNQHVSLNKMLVGVEPIKDEVLDKYMMLNDSMQIINGYGPTEATICSNFYKFGSHKVVGRNVPIGKPLVNNQIYLLDSNDQLVPVGVPGELCISGFGLARGYLFKPEITADKFVSNPFHQGERMYRTGDLARWLPDGNIEYLGRIDFQVKIRGYRIELGEIESQLLKHPEIIESVVMVQDDELGDKNLCAYVVCKKEMNSTQLRAHLSQSLPEYMVPTYFVKIEKIPLTPNGKINRKALPKPENNTNVQYIAPSNEMESDLVRLWEGILGTKSLGVQNNFFEFGGHSLKAVQMISKIHKEMGISLTLKDLFSHPTITELALHIQQLEKSEFSSIPQIEKRETYPVSSAQKRMYILQQMEKTNNSYNMPLMMTIKGDINRTRFENAIRGLISRHESLRTSFEMEAGELVQRVHLPMNIEISYERTDIHELDDLVSRFIQPFDLTQVPLFRIGLIQTVQDEHLFLLDMHHIISDGFSMNILVQNFVQLYEGVDLPPLRVQYKEFAVWQNELFETKQMEKQKQYWLNQFAGELPVLNLPTDYLRPSIQSFEGDHIEFHWDYTFTNKINQLAQKTNTTLYMVLLSAYTILLSKYSGQEDIIVGSPIAGRNHVDLDPIVGIFVNTLAMRNQPEGIKSFNAFLAEVKENTLRAIENESYPLEELIENLDLKRDMSRNPLFSVLFNMLNMEQQEVELEDLSFQPYPMKSRISKFDMTLTVIEDNEELSFKLEYCSKLFKKETMERMVHHLGLLVEQLATNPDKLIQDLDMLTEQEKHQLLVQFNDTSENYCKYKTIHEQFEEQAAKTPNNIAVVFEDQKLTYQQLNEKANQLANVLRNKGVQADELVGMMVERSLEMIIGIYGILKAGGAYVPIDPGSPKERIEYMLKNSGSNILLTTEKLLGDIEFDGQTLDLLNKELFIGDSFNLETINNASHLAYVLYTSGTTGNPKGVMIEHNSVNNLVLALNKSIYSMYNNELNVALVAPYYFDASVKQIFVALTKGHTLHLVPENTRNNGEELLNFYEKNSIDISDGTPIHISMMSYFIENREECKLKHLIIGGEILNIKQVRQVLNGFSDVRITNVYGPTECTVDTTTYLVQGNESNIPIGKPIANSRIYIVDKFNNLLPIGVSGQLCISGSGVARGYLNLPEFTAEKFVSNPYKPGELMYQTGDLARWTSDGNIEYLGRIDHQVKIRGFRFELGEVESHLLKHSEIMESVVTVKENGTGEKTLCAYLICNTQVNSAQLRECLSKFLPEYMIPSFFVQLEKMPLTPNGKIDRKALPQPEGIMNTGIEYVAPRNELESQLVSLWEKVLGVDGIGIQHNFFEMGGHSLKAVQLISIIQKEMEVSVSLKDIFEHPTIIQLAKCLQQLDKLQMKSLRQAETREVYPTSSAQKRLYVLQQLEGADKSYNMPSVMEIKGDLNRARFEKAIYGLISHHESLRTSFEVVEGEPVQRIHSEIDFEISYKKAEELELGTLTSAFVQSFDLTEAPLLRVSLIEINKEKHFFLLDMHHIISDGTSMNILLQDFVQLYEGNELPSLRVQYKDFAVWQDELFTTGQMEKQKQYWLTQFADELPVLNLPTDYTRPPMQSFEGDHLDFRLNQTVTSKLKQMAIQTNTTMYMIMMAAYTTLLYKYTGQEDIIVGSPVAGRNHTDIEPIMGMFVNTLAMRNAPKGHKSFQSFLEEVKENTLQGIENDSYPLEELIENLDLQRDTSRNPLFNVMFNMLNMEFEDMKLESLSMHSYPLENKVSQFDMTLSVAEEAGEIQLNVEYCTKLYKRETIERLIVHFSLLIEQIVEQPEIKLDDIDIISKQEKYQLLVEFNDTKVEYSKEKNVIDLFDEQLKLNPTNKAIVHADEEITYEDLDKKVNSIAQFLIHEGVKTETIVSLMLERSIEMIASILAIHKVGGVYLPIDSSYPTERIKHVLNDSKSHYLITDRKTIETMNLDFSGKLIYITDIIDELTAQNVINKVGIRTNHLAYILYTSGSTGLPKGVMVEHLSLTNQVLGLIQDHGYYKMKNHMLYSKSIFDVSLQHIYTALCSGACLHLMTVEMESNYDVLYRYVQNNHIEFIDMVPAQMEHIVKNLEPDTATPRFVLGGEAFHGSLYKKLVEYVNADQIFNMYGPTETTINALIYQCRENDSRAIISIGKPMRNYQAFILDINLNLLPIGVVGELCISGDGLARGYLNQPELTNEKFVAHPFELEKRIYRTGDLAKWLPDGNIEFIERIDQQVKIRGNRIELGEIESNISEQIGVQEAVVLHKIDKFDNSYLCGFVVIETSTSVDKIVEGLYEKLPSHMIPSYMVEVDRIPLTSNGKIDRNSLLKMEVSYTKVEEYVAPSNKLESQLVSLWEEVLDIKTVGIKDNFFELGGHSIKAVQIVTKLHKEMNVNLTLRDIFTFPTIEQFSKRIQQLDQHQYHFIPQLEQLQTFPASSAQKRMYVLQQLEEHNTSYNMPSVMTITGDLNQKRFEKAMDALVERHESLRTSFEMLEDELVQRVHDQVDVEIQYTKAQHHELERLDSGFIQPFKLGRAPLFRVQLIQYDTDQHLFVFDMHHIISDGTSMNLLIQDFIQLYEGIDLPDLRIQYKDFAVWQNEMFATKEMEKQKQYWLDQFSDELPVLNLPTDYMRPSIQSFEGDHLHFKLDKRMTTKLGELAKETNTTLYMILLAIYTILLSKYAGQEDIIVGSPTAGRTHVDTEPVVGMFVNTLVIRNVAEADKTFTSFLTEVKENTLRAIENENYPLEDLLESLNLTRDMSRNPLFSVMFNMLNIEMKEMKVDNLSFKPYPLESHISKFDLTLTVREESDGLLLNIEYCTKLFKQDTIERMITHLSLLTEQIIEKPEATLGEFDMLTEQEKQQQLVELNDTTVDYPKHKTMIQLLEEQVEKTPNHVAVEFEDQRLTYEELNGRVNQLARMLKNKGIGPDQLVAIMVEHSIEMIIGVLGIMKAGGAYVPIDPTYPTDRILYMLEDTNCRLLLVTNETNDIVQFTGEVMNLNDSNLYRGMTSNLEVINQP